MYPGVRVQSVSSAVRTSPLQSVSAVGQRSGHFAVTAHIASATKITLPVSKPGFRSPLLAGDGDGGTTTATTTTTTTTTRTRTRTTTEDDNDDDDDD